MEVNISQELNEFESLHEQSSQQQNDSNLVDTSCDSSMQANSNFASNLNNSSMNESMTTCSDDTCSSGSRKSRADIPFPSDLLKNLRRVKNQSLERKDKKRHQNKLRLKRQASLVDIVAEEDKAETEKITQKRRVLPHLKLIFDDGEKSEDSEILQQIQRLRCSSVDKLPKVIEEDNDLFQNKIFESDEESGDEGSGSLGFSGTFSANKISGFFNVSNIIDKQELLVDTMPVVQMQAASKKHQTSSCKKAIYPDDVIKEEEYDRENAGFFIGELKTKSLSLMLNAFDVKENLSTSSCKNINQGQNNCSHLITDAEPGYGTDCSMNSFSGNTLTTNINNNGATLHRSLSAGSLFSSTSNSPRYRLKVDELDEFDEMNKKAVANAKKSIAFTTPAEYMDAVIVEEVEKENDNMNDLLQKVRNQIEKQETFLKKIAMQTDEFEGEMFSSRGDYFEQIEEIEVDYEKNSSSEETPDEDDEDQRTTKQKN